MTQKEKAALAEALLANPLFHSVFDDLERSATEAMIYAGDDTARARFAMRVQEIRAFRQDCNTALRATTPNHGAVA